MKSWEFLAFYSEPASITPAPKLSLCGDST